MKKNLFNAYSCILIAALLVLLPGCELLQDLDPPVAKNKVFYGPSVAIGNGTARTWLKVSNQGKPMSIGVDISDAAMASLPANMEIYHLMLPAEASSTTYKMVMLDWNPHGHEPAIYDAPHFDVHFYTIDDTERLAIQPGPQNHSEQFQANYMPATYFSTVMAVPAMGVHWIDALSPEVQGTAPFTKTFIYGANNDKVIFYEPMVTLAYLQQLPANKPDKAPVAQAPHVQTSGFYPLSYTLSRMTTSGHYTIALTDLRFRKAQ